MYVFFTGISKITWWFIEHSSQSESMWTLDINVKQHTDHFTHPQVGMSIYPAAAVHRSPVEFWPPLFAESMSPCHHLLPIIWSANSSRSHNIRNIWQWLCCQLALKVDPSMERHTNIPVFVIPVLLCRTSCQLRPTIEGARGPMVQGRRLSEQERSARNPTLR